MYDKAIELINQSNNIVIIQAENPDADSLGSSLALEELLSDLGKTVSLYCPVEIPKYMRYIKGWDRVDFRFDHSADTAIIVDTMSEVLLTKVIESPGVRHFLENKKVLVIDHHITESDIKFGHTALVDTAVASGEIIYNLAEKAKWSINTQAAENILIAIMGDSLGFTVPNVTAHTFYVAQKLTEQGASTAEIEKRRRDYMKKSAEILAYKGKLLERIDYYLDGKLALIHIPWEEIEKYSDQYNPSVLVLDEMRLVENVEIGIAVKTYPDGKLTGKLRSNIPISAIVAGYFGGGGHDYAAGFRIYESVDKVIPEIISAVDKAIKDYHKSDQIA